MISQLFQRHCGCLLFWVEGGRAGSIGFWESSLKVGRLKICCRGFQEHRALLPDPLAPVFSKGSLGAQVKALELYEEQAYGTVMGRPPR